MSLQDHLPRVVTLALVHVNPGVFSLMHAGQKSVWGKSVGWRWVDQCKFIVETFFKCCNSKHFLLTDGRSVIASVWVEVSMVIVLLLFLSFLGILPDSSADYVPFSMVSILFSSSSQHWLHVLVMSHLLSVFHRIQNILWVQELNKALVFSTVLWTK